MRMPVSKIIVKSVNQQGCILTAQKHISLREKNGAMITGACLKFCILSGTRI